MERYIGLDLPSKGRVDVIGDVIRLPFRRGSFDTVLCTKVFEHVPEPSVVLAEVAVVLKPGWYLLLTTPRLGICIWNPRLLPLHSVRSKVPCRKEWFRGH